ncbi:MAG: hypothetical protein IKU43_10935 [Clostridia bacterium]|nr:hypothetical protein [Clostridia bacterium]
MNYKNLPPIREELSLKLSHFPNNFYCAVFRFWETVNKERIALALEASVETVEKCAEEMGLPKQIFRPEWERRGYITTIRNAWHILPYEQLLTLLDWDADKLAVILKEDDFLRHKLGEFKPFCERVTYREPSGEERERLSRIKQSVSSVDRGIFDGSIPFDFFSDDVHGKAEIKSEGLRLVYSYCGLYASVLDDDISLSYPERLFEMYRDAGVNAVWLQAVLYRLVPFTFDESYSEGYRERQQKLREICNLAKKYGIKIFLYINEPRCMPLSFFESHPELLGKVHRGANGALCLSDKRVIEYLRYGIRTLCEAVPEIGGFFTITCSENLTHCKSRTEDEPCEKCKHIPISEQMAQIITAVSEESRRVNPDIVTVAWTWSWEYFMPFEEIEKCIASIPREVIIQSNSEAHKEFCIGGVSGKVADYSMSIPGPAPTAMKIWECAKKHGHEVSAKVQVNDTWECSTVTYLPVFDLIREHMTGLRNYGVKHLMLSWTLGGYPSVNFKVASSCLEDPSESAYDRLLSEEYGEYAPLVRESAKIFSDAFRNFPFHINTVYLGPQNAGPSNLLYAEPSGFNATMTCYAFDDLDSWRSIYPRDVYINQLRLLSEIWKKGLDVIESMPDCEYKQMATAGYGLFRSSYLQAEFCDKRDTADKAYLALLVLEERKLATEMYSLMTDNNLIGYEAANHYYFNKGMLLEKLVNCDYILNLYR